MISWLSDQLLNLNEAIQSYDISYPNEPDMDPH